MTESAGPSSSGRPLAILVPGVIVGAALGAALAFAFEGGIERRLDDLADRLAALQQPMRTTGEAVGGLAARLDRLEGLAQRPPAAAPALAASGPAPAAPVRLDDECRAGRQRLEEVESLLADAAAPSLAPWEAGRLLSAAAGTLSALEARLYRYGGCLAGEIADARDRIQVGRIAARRLALAPVRATLAADEAIDPARLARDAMAALAAARVGLSRAEAAAGQSEPDAEMRALERRLEDAFGRWNREQQRRYDVWALERARALGEWAQRNISDIPLRGAGKAEISAKLVEQLGPVEPRQLGPAVQAVHGELFQRFWRELGEEQRIQMVADLVAAPKRLPAEM
ncbi:MAG: hypothetical protein IT561_21250 [Alphaproteobacteria bacterium]|nr:hypothetical protein [Alphaproteobacteria bacterium]